MQSNVELFKQCIISAKKIADEVQIISHIQYQTCGKNLKCPMRNYGSMAGHVTAASARWHEEKGLYLFNIYLRIYFRLVEI